MGGGGNFTLNNEVLVTTGREDFAFVGGAYKCIRSAFHCPIRVTKIVMGGR